jgi:23S rRNA U2552 (ribose-2'-O)-methylase RlmE/FtsJ
VTADGSIDCANFPSEQETITSKLHYSELVAALHVLHPGGHFVLKMFTLFEDSSVSLMYILRTAFDKV